MDKCRQFSPRLNSSCRGHCNFDDAISCLYMKTFLNSGASLGARMASISSWRLWPLPCGICAESARTGMLVLKPQSRSRRHGARTADCRGSGRKHGPSVRTWRYPRSRLGRLHGLALNDLGSLVRMVNEVKPQTLYQ